jgi:RNA polymerase sigma factor (sigma-70 family)
MLRKEFVLRQKNCTLAKNSNIKSLNSNTSITTEFLESCAKQDKKSIEQLYKLCFSYLMPMCMKYYANEEDARSTFNLGFMKIINHVDAIKNEPVAFISWSRRIMTNTLIDEYRKNKKYRDRISSRDNERELDFNSDGCSNHADSNIGQQLILKLLDKLKPATKQVFVLYVVEGYNHREISEMLNMSEGTSKWHLSSARKELQYYLEKYNQFFDITRLAI